MGCCGQGRAAIAQTKLAANSAATGTSNFTKLRFTRNTAILIRGPVTGRHYQFHEGAYSQQVDMRDAAPLIKTGYFQPD